MVKNNRLWHRFILVVLGLLLASCGGEEISLQPTVTPTAVPTATPIECDPTPGELAPGFMEEFPPRTELAPPDFPGERMKITGTIYAADCVTPLPGAILYVRHADSQGEYDRTEPYDLVGQIYTDEAGQYEFSSIKPAGYGTGNSQRPAHIHAVVTINDGRLLSTQMYFADDPIIIGSNAPEALIIELTSEGSADGPVLSGVFDIVLPVAPPTPAPDFTDEDL